MYEIMNEIDDIFSDALDRIEQKIPKDKHNDKDHILNVLINESGVDLQKALKLLGLKSIEVNGFINKVIDKKEYEIILVGYMLVCLSKFFVEKRKEK